MPHQLPLDLEAPDRYSRDRFIATPPLRDVLSLLERDKSWLSPHLILQGPTGSGKTHLGHIFAADHDGLFLSAADTHQLDPARLEARPYVVDDAEMADEEALFHLSNHVQTYGQKLVLTTHIQPLMWETHLPDLASRLRAMRLIVLPEPDEDLLTGIFHKLFSERAISPSADCIDYLVRRMDRSVATAQKIVTELEHYANGRPFNRMLARDYMESGQTSLFDEST
ncbi:chromosomal replication initiator DnaA [Asticcacaulis sp. EMRT-3]|uniref:chromosomal replication initiator DnaA n=1 Tax=Asticcacaulis sp. EMRT-3 TaxID=3040349 RepID=UPI0024AEB56C|nr:chromosomal replication initiator DnaA [Asticcacaulis sp. EMRT-3]MDI7774560.1 chromosomal replication initiator DnaA [Asticcacaulis sp. EMRT-3]